MMEHDPQELDINIERVGNLIGVSIEKIHEYIQKLKDKERLKKKQKKGGG